MAHAPAALTLQPAGDGSPVSIETTYWRLAQIGDDVVSGPAGAFEPHLVFQSGGRVTAADGCNTMKGLYELSGDRISIGPLVGTLKACDEAMGLDRRFREAVGSATHWKATAAALDLLDAKGTVLARFDARRP